MSSEAASDRIDACENVEGIIGKYRENACISHGDWRVHMLLDALSSGRSDVRIFDTQTVLQALISYPCVLLQVRALHASLARG